MTRRKIFPPEDRPVIVRSWHHRFFTTCERAYEYAERPGARWRKQVVHVDDCRRVFLIGTDGRCVNCQRGGRCWPFKLTCIDISRTAFQRASRPTFGIKGRKDLLKPRPPFVRVFDGELERGGKPNPLAVQMSVDEHVYELQLKRTLYAMAPVLRMRLDQSIRYEIFGELAMKYFREASLRAADAREERVAYYTACSAKAAENLAELTTLLDGFFAHVPQLTHVKPHIAWSWRRWAENGLAKVHNFLGL